MYVFGVPLKQRNEQPNAGYGIHNIINEYFTSNMRGILSHSVLDYLSWVIILATGLYFYNTLFSFSFRKLLDYNTKLITLFSALSSMTLSHPSILAPLHSSLPPPSTLPSHPFTLHSTLPPLHPPTTPPYNQPADYWGWICKPLEMNQSSLRFLTA